VSRAARWDAFALLFLVLGEVLRGYFLFPLGRLPGDSDMMLSGACALDVLAGDLPLMFPAGRLGPWSCYVTAGWIEIVGQGRFAVALAPLTFWLGTMFLSWRALRLLTDARAAAIGAGLIAAIPPGVAFVSVFPLGYAELTLAYAAIFYCAVRIVQFGWSARRAVLSGVVAGLALWTSLQALTALLPAVLWMVVQRRPQWRHLALAGLAMGIAILPALVGVAHSSTATGLGSFAALERSPRQLWANLTFVLAHGLSRLFLITDLRDALHDRMVQLLLFGYAALIATSILAARKARQAKLLVWLAALLVISVLGAVCVSKQAMALDGPARYMLPVWFCLPALAAAAAIRHARLAAALVVLIGYVHVQLVPGADFHRAWARDLDGQLNLVEDLQRNEVELVVGDYWRIGAMQYDSGDRILIVPTEPLLDFWARRRTPNIRRIALVGTTPEQVAQWCVRAELSGSSLIVGGDRAALVVDLPAGADLDGVLQHLRAEAPPS
jgi:Dolichyl-phosphate-mannose-protein mannosyltransferase